MKDWKVNILFRMKDWKVNILFRMKDWKVNIQNEGLEVMISSLFRLCCSSLLIMGARSGRPWFLVPWLVEECIEMAGGALQFLLHMSRNGGWTFIGLLLISLLYALGAYFIFSVYSFHSKLRWMSRQSHEVISSVSQGGFQAGLNYQRLEDECWQTDPNLAREFDLRNSGFVRESKISVEEPDDYVLYVK
ncbi:uncharacterized protein LOC111709918 isoform X2 [Eurytemora carolleeae]|uniref:uncharacterized protein LOC111709918 isoform X2 n=1 Tax=Eurytemora carolleeae TaxID=1294199 RepID=UPI000C78386C|nr:uncharacterized protein LOC111709918 isoform X2 [Eurytemora carolleeae]XP_023339629.1 uncharacterized protein LOC111709918 isoform X2 [Eurytemora carolleeae]XP_023339630.1 uncharacterized protein LOC111709918 isoform X2 [Eurytemora carolleeae]XP_023339631.1 uncharacterized protein LOC111709918 isoform X2 [Eurytemora carolleeae]|eukprot:XP_023339628.1 uncharacterized protein LOC111709918 isoform X2 [Eurytemora affinis]